FLRQLKKHPEDLDTLRVYADWLDDRGDDVGTAFLRQQGEILDLAARRRGVVGRTRRLAALGASLPTRWLAVVSRPRLVGTCWAGHDSDGAFYVFRYLARGK